MIGKAKAISHGINDLRYIMGESKNKKEPEKINFICCQYIPKGLDAMGVWESMQATTTGFDILKNTLVQVELSPAKEYTIGYSRKDWEKLWADFMHEFDCQTISNKNGKVTSRPTNLSGSKGVVYLHEESRGGIPHLHGAFCRVDEDGDVNNDHDIHLRAQRAAEAVARKRGWKTAMDVRAEDIKHVAEICKDVLKAMPYWSWEDYVARIEQNPRWNLQVKARTDRNGQVRGYAIVNGNSKFKASQLGREFTFSRLADTWESMHTITVSIPGKKCVKNFLWGTKDRSAVPMERDVMRSLPQQPMQELSKFGTANVEPKRQDYSSWTPERTPINIDVDGVNHHLYLPKNVVNFFDDIFDYREIENWKPLTNLACAIFAGLLALDTPVSTGGGGSSSNNNCGRNKDEDDIEFARRCANMAKQKMGLKKKSNGFRR